MFSGTLTDSKNMLTYKKCIGRFLIAFCVHRGMWNYSVWLAVDLSATAYREIFLLVLDRMRVLVNFCNYNHITCLLYSVNTSCCTVVVSIASFCSNEPTSGNWSYFFILYILSLGSARDSAASLPFSMAALSIIMQSTPLVSMTFNVNLSVSKPCPWHVTYSCRLVI
jgi:hypothetical protein